MFSIAIDNAILSVAQFKYICVQLKDIHIILKIFNTWLKFGYEVILLMMRAWIWIPLLFFKQECTKSAGNVQKALCSIFPSGSIFFVIFPYLKE